MHWAIVTDASHLMPHHSPLTFHALGHSDSRLTSHASPLTAHVSCTGPQELTHHHSHVTRHVLTVPESVDHKQILLPFRIGAQMYSLFNFYCFHARTHTHIHTHTRTHTHTHTHTHRDSESPLKFVVIHFGRGIENKSPETAANEGIDNTVLSMMKGSAFSLGTHWPAGRSSMDKAQCSHQIQNSAILASTHALKKVNKPTFPLTRESWSMRREAWVELYRPAQDRPPLFIFQLARESWGVTCEVWVYGPAAYGNVL